MSRLTWQYTLIISLLGRLRREDHKFQANLGFMGGTVLTKQSNETTNKCESLDSTPV